MVGRWNRDQLNTMLFFKNVPFVGGTFYYFVYNSTTMWQSLSYHPPFYTPLRLSVYNLGNVVMISSVSMSISKHTQIAMRGHNHAHD